MSFSPSKQNDQYWMAKAIELAWRGKYTTTPNPNVGCVIVDTDNQLVGQGAHLQAGQAHAEVYALQQAGSKTRGATAYVTLEPCSHTGKTPPCADALIEAGIKRVVVANVDPNPLVSGKGLKRLYDNGIDVESGILEQQAAQLNLGFFKRMRLGKPFVRVKMAASLDGRIALANGKSQWITGPAARKDVQRYRAMSSAILTGSGTVKADNPSLLVREQEANLDDYPDLPLRQPLRYVVDSQRSLGAHFQLFNDGYKTVIVSTTDGNKSPFANTVNFSVLASQSNRVSLIELLDAMGQDGINDLWVEAGAKLSGELIRQQLVDELIVYIAPKLLGDKGLPLLHLPQYTELTDAPNLVLEEATTLGTDIRLTYTFRSQA